MNNILNFVLVSSKQTLALVLILLATKMFASICPSERNQYVSVLNFICPNKIKMIAAITSFKFISLSIYICSAYPQSQCKGMQLPRATSPGIPQNICSLLQ